MERLPSSSPKKVDHWKKFYLLPKCSDAITSKAASPLEPLAQKILNFAMHVDEKLVNLDKRTRRFAEKHNLMFYSKLRCH